MRLQTASRLALLSVLDLAADPARQRSAGEIAEAYRVSLNHLAKVLRDLNRAGLVESVRGVGGGYRFCGNAKRTTLLDVIQIFENVSGDATVRANPIDASATEAALSLILKEIDDTVQATLQSITIDTAVKLIQKLPPRG
ncbi:MAG: Rrf2 family transcriptional regulator [Alphaproteobacteria bacterium]|nr:Rrf2 family transcriptional regulator [Alphaproteobacteria bacterium]